MSDFDFLKDTIPGTPKEQETPAPQVQTPAPQVQTPAPQVQTPAPQVQTPAPNPVMDINEELPKLNTITLGKRVSAIPIERFKAKKDIKYRFAFVSANPFITKAHYNQTLRSFLCFDGDCCTEGLPKVKYNFPISLYEVNSKGLPVSTECELKILSIGEESYNNIVAINEVNPNGIAGRDIVITCSDDQYQKLAFIDAGQSYFHTSKEFATPKAAINAEWNAKQLKAPLAVGKVVDAQTYSKLMNRATQQSNEDVGEQQVMDAGQVGNLGLDL